MKYITYAVITALMFGMAFAPSIHDELAFAQTAERNPTSIDRTEEAGWKKISKERQSTNFEESKSRLIERSSTMSNEQIFQLHERLQSIREVHDSLKEKLDAGVALRLSLDESEQERVYQTTKEQRLSDRLFYLNLSPEQRAHQIQELKNKVMERRYTTISPYVQIILGSDLTEVICPLDRYLVIRNSNGLPNCMSYFTATTLVNRGIVSYPE